MKYKNLTIGASYNDRVYLGGVLSKDGTRWIGDKKDVTSEFYQCLLNMYAGYDFEIFSDSGKKYKVTVQEIE